MLVKNLQSLLLILLLLKVRKMIFKVLKGLLRVCGVFPSSNKLERIFPLLSLVLTCSVSFEFLTSVFEHRDIQRVLLELTGLMPIILGTLQILVVTLCNPNAYSSIMEDLESQNEELKHLGQCVEFSKVGKLTIATFVIQWLWVGIQLTYKPLMDIVRTMTLDVLFNAPLQQHLMMVDVLQEMFFTLNEEMKRISASSDKTLSQIVSLRLDSVFRIHSALHVIVTDCNSYFFFYNLTSVTSRLFCVIHVMYTIFKSISESQETIPVGIVLFFIHQVIFLSVQAVACHYCSEEANKTLMMAHRILQPDTDSRLWLEIGRFSRLTFENKVYFTVGGIFSLKMKFLTNISVMAFSYLVIAIQLKDVSLVGAHTLSNNASTLSNSTTIF